jgi:glyoxylase-like metal-dependent hydrolase (beta-lactamase superfamily II)
MREILPGLHHWTAFHEGIRTDVSSYFIADSGTLIDPMVPPGDGLAAFAELGEPQVILLTNRHHYRHGARFVDAFSCPVLCHRSGLHEFEGGPEVEGFDFGDAVAPDIVALEVGALCPDDSALRIASKGALAFADGLVHWGGGTVGFVPDGYMGDDPEAVKRGLRASFKRLLAEEDFDALLFAHGDPITTGGREALRSFVEA